jgi:hypothetical protein
VFIFSADRIQRTADPGVQRMHFLFHKTFLLCTFFQNRFLKKKATISPTTNAHRVSISSFIMCTNLKRIDFSYKEQGDCFANNECTFCFGIQAENVYMFLNWFRRKKTTFSSQVTPYTILKIKNLLFFIILMKEDAHLRIMAAIGTFIYISAQNIALVELGKA